MRFPARWLPSAALGVCLFPLLVMAWVPQPRRGEEVQEVLTDTAWVPRHGVYVSAYFDRFDTHDGARTLQAVEFELVNHFTFRHGIEVLDDAPWRVNILGAGAADCDCANLGDCDGGTWIKSRLEILLGDQKVPLDACTSYLPQGVSILRAPGPFDGVNDQAGYSGRAVFTDWTCPLSTSRLSDAEVPGILEEFTWDGQGSSPSYESVHCLLTYGGAGQSSSRLDCQPRGYPAGAEGVNNDSSYDHWGAVAIRLTMIYTE